MKNPSCFRNVLSIICAVWGWYVEKQVGSMHGKKKTVSPLFTAISEKIQGNSSG